MILAGYDEAVKKTKIPSKWVQIIWLKLVPRYYYLERFPFTWKTGENFPINGAVHI